MKSTLKGYQESTGTMVYEFINPHGGKNITKHIKPIIKEDGTLDKAAMELRVGQHALSVDNRMKIASTKTPTAKDLGLEAYIPPTNTEDGVDDSDVIEDADVIEEFVPKAKTKDATKSKSKNTKPSVTKSDTTEI